MAVKLNSNYLKGFLTEAEIEALYPEVKTAHNTLNAGSGKGNDFLGWLNLPKDYDKEEFGRIKKAAAKIKSDSDILIVIGIGGSYLGARAAIELLRSPFYNNIKKDTPQIFFAGNNINPTYLNELLSICEGKDISINVISKSGTTTEPALAFRIFRELLEKKYGADGAKGR
ncbi:MAG: glucose-6-phosphate isomerase, partial [Hydrogenoanaerobacterium sp.]